MANYGTQIPRDAPAWLRNILEQLLGNTYSDNAPAPNLGQRWRISEIPFPLKSSSKAFVEQNKTGTRWDTVAGHYANGADIRDLYASYRTVGGQSIPNGLVYTVIDFATKEYDTDFSVKTGTAWSFTVPKFKGGVYEISSWVHFVDSVTAIKEANLRININNNRYYVLHSDSVSVNSEFALAGSASVYLKEGDVVCLEVDHNASGARTLEPSGYVTIQRMNGSTP